MNLAAITFREIGFGSDDYQQAYELRNAVLRVPLGLRLTDEDLSVEAGQQHFGLFSVEGKLLACVIAVLLEPGTGRIRQMAVAKDQQGRGYGRSIIQQTEDRLWQRDVSFLFMHARISAAGFYEKLGYEKTGPPFLEIGLPHLRMEKRLR